MAHKNFIEIRAKELNRLKSVEKIIKDLPEKLKPIKWGKDEKENNKTFPIPHDMVEIHILELARLKEIDLFAKKQQAQSASKKEIKT